MKIHLYLFCLSMEIETLPEHCCKARILRRHICRSVLVVFLSTHKQQFQRKTILVATTTRNSISEIQNDPGNCTLQSKLLWSIPSIASMGTKRSKQLSFCQQSIILGNTDDIEANQSLQSHRRAEGYRDLGFSPAASWLVPEITPNAGSWGLLKPCNHWRDTHFY